MEQERKYKEDLARLNSKVIPSLTTDLSQEREEVRELKRVVAISNEGKHLVKQEAQIEWERATSKKERTASIDERVAIAEERAVAIMERATWVIDD